MSFYALSSLLGWAAWFLRLTRPTFFLPKVFFLPTYRDVGLCLVEWPLSSALAPLSAHTYAEASPSGVNCFILWKASLSRLPALSFQSFKASCFLSASFSWFCSWQAALSTQALFISLTKSNVWLETSGLQRRASQDSLLHFCGRRSAQSTSFAVRLAAELHLMKKFLNGLACYDELVLYLSTLHVCWAWLTPHLWRSVFVCVFCPHHWFLSHQIDEQSRLKGIHLVGFPHGSPLFLKSHRASNHS